MKKIIFSLATVSLLAIGCAKEQPINDKVETPTPSNGKVTLTANMPNFIDDATKATIDGSTGAFSWNDDDTIDVKYYLETDHSVTKTYPFRCINPSSGLFENTVTIDEGYVIASDADVVATYSGSSSAYYYDFRTFADNPGKYFFMEAKVDENGKLAFEHKSALVKLTLKNVPSFTYAIYVGTGDSNSNLTQLEYLNYSSNQESLTYYIPVRPTASDAKMNIKVYDNSWNSIVEKKSSGEVQVKAGHLYVLPELNIGPILTFQGTGLSSISKVKCTQKIGDNYGSNNVTWDLNSLSSIKYVALPYASTGYYDWLEEGVDAVRVDVYDSDNNFKGFTEYVYVRNIDFEITSGETGLKAEYRIYPYGTTTADHLYATYATGTYDTPDDITFNITDTDGWWSSNTHWYASNGSDIGSAWPGTNYTGGSFTIPSSSIYQHTTVLVINNGNNEQTHDLSIDGTSTYNHVSTINITIDASWDNGKRPISITSSVDADEIIQYPLGGYPGKAVSIPSSKSTYVAIPASYAGKTLQLYFNDGTSDVRTWPNVGITRDYEYSF